jgi:type II secretory pathway pseudopilin PulG
MTYRRKISQSGLSTLEVMVVVIIVGVLTALAKAPMDQYLKTIRHKGAVGEIKRMLQTARSRALANPGVHCGAYFDLSSRPQKIQLFNDTFAPATYAYDGTKDKAYLAPYPMPVGVNLSIDPLYPPAIIFRGDGSAYLSGKVVMKFDNFTDTLDVLASTGRIKTSQ